MPTYTCRIYGIAIVPMATMHAYVTVGTRMQLTSASFATRTSLPRDHAYTYAESLHIDDRATSVRASPAKIVYECGAPIWRF